MLLISILVVGTVSLALVLGSAVRIIGALRSGEGDIKSREAFGAAESCVQESLLRLARNVAFTGATLTVGAASCSSSVTSEGGARRKILATGNRDHWSHSVTVRADIVSPEPIILEWREW